MGHLKVLSFVLQQLQSTQAPTRTRQLDTQAQWKFECSWSRCNRQHPMRLLNPTWYAKIDGFDSSLRPRPENGLTVSLQTCWSCQQVCSDTGQTLQRLDLTLQPLSDCANIQLLANRECIGMLHQMVHHNKKSTGKNRRAQKQPPAQPGRQPAARSLACQGCCRAGRMQGCDHLFYEVTLPETNDTSHCKCSSC